MIFTVALALEPWASAVLFIEAPDPDAALAEARQRIADALGQGEASALRVISVVGETPCAHTCLHPLGAGGVCCCRCKAATSVAKWLAQGFTS